MAQKFIITINRGFGSGGRTVGGMLSRDLDVKFYDNDLIKIASENSGVNERLFGKSDETVKKSLFKKENIYKGDILLPDSSDFVSEDNIFNLQAKIIKDIADNESCVIIGRCADFILRDRQDVIKVFIHAPKQKCISRVCELYGVEQKEAEKIIEKTDKRRADYYRYYTGKEWNDATNYDLCLDTDKLTYEKCVQIIKNYINELLK